MNLADLTKEQKQYVGFGLGIVVLVVLVAIGGRFGLSALSVVKLELAELTEKIERADKALALQNQNHKDFTQTTLLLRTQLENLPPQKNYYSWATEIVYSKGRDSGVEIQSVDEVLTRGKVKKAAGKGSLSFEAYSFRIVARGGYEPIKQFISNIEEEHPLIRFTGLEISVSADPQVHEVRMFIQWPASFGDFEKRWEEIHEKQQKLSKRVEPAPMESLVPQPAPVVAAKPEPKPTPVVQQRVLEPVLEPVLNVVVSAPKVVVAAPKPVVKPVPKPIITKKSAPIVAAAAPTPLIQPEKRAVVSESIVQPDEPDQYVYSSKSVEIITKLLMKEGRNSNASLSLFLDGLMEDINDEQL